MSPFIYRFLGLILPFLIIGYLYYYDPQTYFFLLFTIVDIIKFIIDCFGK